LIKLINLIISLTHCSHVCEWPEHRWLQHFAWQALASTLGNGKNGV
jgi:hypothetical protein